MLKMTRRKLLFFFVLFCPLFCNGSVTIKPLIFPCDDWDKEYPEENGVTNECNMTVNQLDADEFLFFLRKNEYTTRLFKFHLDFGHKETFKTKCAVEPYNWIWTFPGDKGATQFLQWPKEYRVWSLGLLDSHSIGPMDIHINSFGNCPVIFGQNETTQRIGLAMISMLNRAAHLPGANVEYGYGYVCYHERFYIESPAMYNLCLHIVCPFEALGYKCCMTVYEYETNSTRVVCDGNKIKYDDAWWIMPFVVGILMFAFVPICLVKPFQKITKRNDNHFLNLLEGKTNYDGLWLIANPLSFFGIMQTPLQTFGVKFPRLASVLLRIIIVFCSLAILVFQLLVHYMYDYEYTVILVESGVPLAFRSMVAGYTKSKRNFMPRLGGPYVGLGIYFFTTVILVCIPSDLETFINLGIPNNILLSVSPLTMDVKTRGKLGAVFDIERQFGYQKIYSLMKAHIFMLINPSFWSLAFQMQFRRFCGFLHIMTPNKYLKIFLLLLFIMPYVCILCVIELTLTLVYYGFPIFLFFQVTVCAVCNGIKTAVICLGTPGKIIQYLSTLIVVGMLVFNIYILTVVFVDSFHFITRVLMFTFTGLIAYPGTTYGYFVFAITVLMYVTEAIQQIHNGYSILFKYVKKCCIKVQRMNSFPRIQLIRIENGVNMISRGVFFFVVSRHRPIRVEIFFSILKLTFITFMLFLAISAIVKLQGLWDINPLTQVVTALFICLVPKFSNKLMTTDEYLSGMREMLIIQKLVVDYCRQNLHTRDLAVNKTSFYDEDNDAHEEKALLDGTDNRSYNSVTDNSNYMDDEEMRSELLLDMANDL